MHKKQYSLPTHSTRTRRRANIGRNAYSLELPKPSRHSLSQCDPLRTCSNWVRSILYIRAVNEVSCFGEERGADMEVRVGTVSC